MPRTQAEALMAVCAGKVGFECTIVPLRGGKQALLQRFIAPGVLDLLSVEFEEGEDANGFVPPAWFGPEVTQNAAYHRGSLARVGLPAPEEIPLSNAMLNDLLDTIEEGAVAAQLGRAPSQRTPGTRSVGEHPEVSTEANSLPAPLAERAPERLDCGPCRGSRTVPGNPVRSRHRRSIAAGSGRHAPVGMTSRLAICQCSGALVCSAWPAVADVSTDMQHLTRTTCHVAPPRCRKRAVDRRVSHAVRLYRWIRAWSGLERHPWGSRLLEAIGDATRH